MTGGDPQRRFSVAMSTDTDLALTRHIVRGDGQEDLCFALWRPSVGAGRDTAILSEPVLPRQNERHVHGNVSFTSEYFLRAADLAAAAGAGLALIHSHPAGAGWQRLSDDDHAAESGHAGRALGLTGLPLVGLTLATTDMTWSARTWIATGARRYRPDWAQSVRVVGGHFRASSPAPQGIVPRALKRSAESWGAGTQDTLARLRVGVVGTGSVGALVSEALARTGIGTLVLVDYDTVQTHNLDRLLHATPADAAVAEAKVLVAARAARAAATAPGFGVVPLDASAVEPGPLSQLKDCDVIFSCVDRPAARAALNALAYAHLIPVVDGGVLVDPGRTRMRGAEWRAHVAAPGRRCLECLGQYDPALVQADRDGLLDDPTYLAALPKQAGERRPENVFALSAAAAAHEVLAFLRMIIAPAGYPDAGAQLFHFATGDVDTDARGCQTGCPYPGLVALGDGTGLPVTGKHLAAASPHEARASIRRAPSVRLALLVRAVARAVAASADRAAAFSERKDRSDTVRLRGVGAAAASGGPDPS